MDEKKTEELENKDEKVEKIDEVKETKEEKTSEEEATFVPEQLDDDDFEKEKEKIKAEKAAKKAEKKAKKNKKEPELDENGNPIKTKRKKSKIITTVIIILIIIFLVVGVVGYLFYSLNKPENAVIDFVSYANGEDWDNAINLIDLQGYLAMVLIDMDAEDDSDVSYANFEEKYNEVFDELDELGYSEVNDVLEYGEQNYTEILADLFGDYSFSVNSVDSIERISDTNLYKVTVTMTITDETGTYDDETDEYEMYVAKIDGSYKIVDGTFPYTIYYYYGVYYAYSSYYVE